MDDDFFGLSPLNFFHISHDCLYHHGNVMDQPQPKYLLPSTTALYHEKNFSDVAIGWNEEGLVICAKIKTKFKESSYPNITLGDSIELFIDTRNVKTSGYNTRFCHHFFFLPEPMSGHQAGEITKFRTEESHTLCDANMLQVRAKINKNDYIMHIFIPSICLFGYDPSQFDQLGFNYRINRLDGISQYFSAIDEEFKIEEQPSLWSSLRLVK